MGMYGSIGGGGVFLSFDEGFFVGRRGRRRIHECIQGILFPLYKGNSAVIHIHSDPLFSLVGYRWVQELFGKSIRRYVCGF